MNKKIIALAVAAAFAAPMAAQAAAKIGGHLQVEIADWDKPGSTSDTLNAEDNKRGRLYVTGSEDLGGGLKANYRYEWQVDTADGSTTGANHTNAREARVGFSGSWGEFQMGRLKSPYKYTGGVDYDPFTATVLESRGNGGALKGNGTMTKAYGQNSFLSNSLAYKTKFGSVKFWALMQLSESDTLDDNIALGLRFKVGGGVEMTVATISEDSGVNSGGTRTKIGATWKSGAHKVVARLENQADDAASSDADTTFLGYHFKMGKNVISVQYGTLDSDINTEDSDYSMVAVTHKFSKKTKAWAGFRSTSFDVNPTGKDTDVISVGMQVRF